MEKAQYTHRKAKQPSMDPNDTTRGLYTDGTLTAGTQSSPAFIQVMFTLFTSAKHDRNTPHTFSEEPGRFISKVVYDDIPTHTSPRVSGSTQ